jgi:hypothetical protein
MQLRRRDALLRLAAMAALFWLITLFGLTFADYLTRSRSVSPSMENGAFTADAHSGRVD